MVFDPILSTKTGIDLINAALSASEKSSVKLSKKKSAALCRALRGIYFTPNGILSLLDDIAKGGKPTAAQIQSVLGDFNDAEWEVQRFAHSLSFDALEGEMLVSLRSARALELIRFGKVSLRRDIQNAINSIGQPRAKISLSLISELSARVRDLNEGIEKLELSLNVSAIDKSSH